MKERKSLIAVIIFILIIAFIATFMDSVFLYTFDSVMYNEIVEKMSPNLTFIMRIITETGNKIMIIILCLSLFIFKRTRKDWAFPVTAAVIISALLNTLIKLVFARERPDILQLVTEPTYSFPSGHAMTNMSFYMMIFMLSRKYINDKKVKIGISIVCFLLPLVIGISRIYLGVHYATDVIAGWLFGAIVSMVIFYFLNKKSNNERRGKYEKTN
jgi:undecaprenyl-diphosphatase